jgi:hypothetical protein
MEVVDFEPGMTAAWDAFVASHPLAGHGHLSANFALASETPGLRNRSLVARDGRAIVGVLPLFERTDRVLRSIAIRELASGAFFPAGPLISPSVKGKAEAAALGQLLEAAQERARAGHVDRVVIAYPNVTSGQPTIVRAGYSPLLHHGYRARPAVGLLLDLSQSPEQLAAGRKSGCRQSIAKAQAAGATVEPIQNREAWMSCYAMNVQTLGALSHSERQLAAMWDHFIAQGHAHAHAVYVNGAMAAVTVTVQAHDCAYYWHGWRSETAAPGTSHLGLWSAILASRDHGCRVFELGSLEFEHAKNIGISQFKQSFGGVPFQTMAAALEMKPVKSAAIALAETTVAAWRQRRRSAAAAPARASAAKAPAAEAPPSRTAVPLSGAVQSPAAVPTAGKH